MEVEIKSLTDEGVERRDYRNVLEIFVDGKRVFSVSDGEPEDATLSRDFNDCWKVGDLMKMAYEAGRTGEDFGISNIMEDEL